MKRRRGEPDYSAHKEDKSLSRFKEFENLKMRELEGVDYNFEAIENIEPLVKNLVEQMEDKIKQGEYEVLISDEKGARILTLIFRKIIKRLSPEDESPETLFISGDYKYHRYRNSEIKEVEQRAKDKNVLLITEFISSGETINDLLDLLEKINVEEASLVSLTHSKYISDNFDILTKERDILSNYYTSDLGDSRFSQMSTLDFYESSERTSGVRKGGGKCLFPYKREDVNFITRSVGQDKEVRTEKKTDIDKSTAQKDRNYARHDVNLLSSKILSRINNQNDN